MGTVIKNGRVTISSLKEDKIYVDFGSESCRVPFDSSDIKYIDSFKDTINDGILQYLYIMRTCKYYVVKAPIKEPYENYGCTITRTKWL
jgi:hypothetical protein